MGAGIVAEAAGAAADPIEEMEGGLGVEREV